MTLRAIDAMRAWENSGFSVDDSALPKGTAAAMIMRPSRIPKRSQSATVRS